jgi:hypothetical protein
MPYALVMAQLWVSERAVVTKFDVPETATGINEDEVPVLPRAASPQHLVTPLVVVAQKLPAFAVPGLPTAPLMVWTPLSPETGIAYGESMVVPLAS